MLQLYGRQLLQLYGSSKNPKQCHLDHRPAFARGAFCPFKLFWPFRLFWFKFSLFSRRCAIYTIFFLDSAFKNYSLNGPDSHFQGASRKDWSIRTAFIWCPLGFLTSMPPQVQSGLGLPPNASSSSLAAFREASSTSSTQPSGASRASWLWRAPFDQAAGPSWLLGNPTAPASELGLPG